jgi:hypothetical protein
MSESISVTFLHPEQQTVTDVTESLVAFLASAREEVAVAIYDFSVDAPPPTRSLPRCRNSIGAACGCAWSITTSA